MLRLLLGLLLLIYTSTTMSSDLKFSGYGSIRAGWLHSEGDNPALPKFYQEDNRIQYKPETSFGIQANYDISDRWDSVIQINSSGLDDFDPQITWAYIGYKINQTHYVRVGRFAMPIFHHSEYEKVGYTHDYSRLPKSVYLGFEFNTVDGISLDSKWILNENTFIRTKFLYGGWKGNLFESITNTEFASEFTDLYSFNLDIEYKNTKFFGGYFHTRTYSEDLNLTIYDMFQPFLSASKASDSEIDSFFNNLYFNSIATYAFIGFSTDISLFHIEGELTNFGVRDSIDQFNTNWYVSVGYQVTDNTAITVQREGYSQSPEGYPQTRGITNPVLLSLVKEGVDQFGAREMRLNSINIRYDISSNMAFKMDYTWGKDLRHQIGKIQFASVGIDILF